MTYSARHPPAASGRLARWAFTRSVDEKRCIGLLRGIFRILIIMILEFPGTNLSLRASALTFSVILSTVPMLAMSTAVLKGLGSGNQMRTAAYRLIDQLDPEPKAESNALPISLFSEEAAESVKGKTEQEQPPLSLNNHLHNAVDTIFNYVENTNFAALGAFGIAGLLIVVVMVLSSVEEAMNAIWHTERGRSLFRKIMDYLALLVLLPISINIALAGDAALASPKIMGYLTTFIPSALSVQMLFKLLPFVFVTLSLMMMYLFFPNVRVRRSAAFCGALFGTVFWFTMQRIYLVLQVGIANYNAIYGSFAMVPLFIIWIRFGWIFILLGAALAYAIQNHNHYRLPGKESSVKQKLQQAFDVLLTVYTNFVNAKITTAADLSKSCLTRNEAELSPIINLLIRNDLLHEVGQGSSAGFIPSRPADQLTADQVIRLVLGQGQETETVGGEFSDQAVQAAEQAVLPADFLQSSLAGSMKSHENKI